jgi:hypothetical protein
LHAPPNATANLLQKQDLAAMIHLCGAASAKAFVRSGFRVIADERCGDHDVATYLGKVNAMSLATNRRPARWRSSISKNRAVRARPRSASAGICS